MMNKYPVLNPTIAKHQSGVVLVISLIMLLALTLIGITSSSVTGLEERMAANSKDVNLAFQAAEATLRDVEANRLVTKPAFDRTSADTAQGVNGIYSTLSACNGTETTSATQRPDETTPSLRPFDSSVNWSGTKIATYDNTTTKKLVGLYQAPRYIIEEISCRPLLSGGGSGSLKAGAVVSSSSIQTEVRMRITARGWGSNANSVVTLQSVIKMTYKD